MVSFSVEGVLTKLQYYTSTKLYRFKKLHKQYKNNDITQDTSLNYGASSSEGPPLNNIRKSSPTLYRSGRGIDDSCDNLPPV